MKLFKKSTIKKALLTCLAVFTTTLCAALGVSVFKPTTAKAATIASTVFQTNGASVRVFDPQLENGEITYKETSRQGIRFHVEMGAGYVYGGQPVLNTAETYDRGSYKITEGFKTYTLVLPTRLLSGDLTVDTAKVVKIDTTEYWFDDDDGNWESVAYLYNIPEKWYTDNFSYRGVICTVAENGTETVVAQTDVAERSLAWVAKQAYNDTIDENSHYWGTADNDNTAAPLIKKFVPTYSITYNVNGAQTTEEVLWGDAPQNVPTEGVKGAWYDTENNEEVDVTKAMDWTGNRTLELHTTSSTEFVLTGVAQETDFVVDSTTYSGFKVFATLHREAFADKTQMDIHAVNVAHMRGGEVVADSFALQGVWTLDEQNSIGEWQMLLFFAIDATNNAELQSGDEIVIKGDSIFYANNVMYKLTEDYTIDYTEINETVDYGMYLGDLYNSDVKGITNCAEDNTGNEGEPNEFTIRVEFYEDVMINGEFTFEFGPDSDTSKYPYPVYIQCGEDSSKLIPVSGGRYYWNEGDHKILELIGAVGSEAENKVFGWHNGDELIAAPGTIVKQNGGYYIFKDEMYGYFLTNGNVDKWGYALGDWVVGDEVAQFTTSEFAAEGSVTETTDYGALADEIRINTTTHWFGQVKVNLLTTEKMSDSAPYAIYCTSADGTVTEIDKVRYHGQAKPEGGNYQILGLCGEGKFAVGDVVTIAAGTRFWLGTQYYTVTNEINYYYNGNYWVRNYDESTMGTLSAASFGDRAHNQTGDDGKGRELRMYFTAPLAGYTEADGGAFDELRIGTGSITFNGNSISYLRYQRWDAGSTWLSFGGYIGNVAFGDKLVIEAGTTIWGATNVAYKFTEKVEWIYSANPNDANRNWSRVRGGVTVSATANNATVSGSGTFAVGETYTLNVAPVGDYLVSAVIVNSKELPLNASNTYTFTVEQSNTINVETVVGHKVYFTVPTGAAVNGGEIANGGFYAVASGNELTFSVAVSEGYKLTGVSGATNNGDGTYTISSVTADTTVTVSVEKLYKVTYSGENASVTANVANGAWVDNGTTVTFTVTANSGCTLLGVSNATKVNATTYTATVSGADLNVVATALKNDEFVDITDRLQMEDRAWGITEDQHAGGSNEIYVAMLDMGITQANGTHYFNTSVNDTWYVGNDAIIAANGGVDIMEYIYVNGVSARKWITDNANGARASNACNCWLSNPAAYPVYVESTAGSGLMIRLAKAVFGTEFTITVKAGFRITNLGGELVAVTKDIDFKYNNATIAKEVITTQYNVTLGNVTGVSVTADGNAVSSGAKLAEGTEITITPNAGYNVNSVTVNEEALTANNGVYTFTLLKNSTIEVSATLKTYTVTVNASNVSVSGVSHGQTVTHGDKLTLSATANTGYENATLSVTGATNNGDGTYTVTGAVTVTASATAKTYTLTVTTNNANVSGVTNNQTITHGETYSFTATAESVLYSLKSVTIGGTEQGTGGSYSFTAEGDTSIVVTAESSICIVEGTMITLADGTQKAVENVQVGDRVLAFNHFTGMVEARPLVEIAHKNEAAQSCIILNLQFSNGTVFRIVGHHGLFDRTLGEYVMIAESNVAEYVGHKFYVGSFVNGEYVSEDVVLTNYYVTTETVRVFSPVTEEIGNYFANGLLNVGPLHRNTLTCGHINYFDFDENMTYVNVQEDIEKYGLYTYEDFADYISEDVFNMLSFKYYKVAVGKGLMTEEDIYGLIYELENA